jgi:hypothetical protein
MCQHAPPMTLHYTKPAQAPAPPTAPTPAPVPAPASPPVTPTGHIEPPAGADAPTLPAAGYHPTTFKPENIARTMPILSPEQFRRPAPTGADGGCSGCGQR